MIPFRVGRRRGGEAGPGMGEIVGAGLDLAAGAAAAEGEADRAERRRGVEAERQQHRGGLLAAGVAGGAGRGQHRRAGPSSRSRPETAGKSRFSVLGSRAAPGPPAPGRGCALRAGPAAAPRARPAPASRLQAVAGEPAGGAEAGDAGDVLGAGPQPALLAGADQDRRQADAAPHVERADALGRVELVAGDREQIDAERRHVDRHLADATARRRCGRGRRRRAPARRPRRPAAACRSRSGRGSRSPGRSWRRSRSARSTGSTTPSAPARTRRTVRPCALSRRAQQASVAGCSIAVVTIAAVRARSGDAADREVARLGAAAGEDDLVRARAPISAATSARAASTAARAARPRRLSEEGLPNAAPQEGQHRVAHLGRDRCRRVEVEIDVRHRRLRGARHRRIRGAEGSRAPGLCPEPRER